MPRLLQLIFAAWLLVGLPLGQHQALLHALDHAVDHGTPQEKCAEHSLYTAFAGGAASTGCGIPATPLHPAGAMELAPAAVSLAPRSAYLSRAPPPPPAAG